MRLLPVEDDVQETGEAALRLVVPIMGLESRLGTLVLEYQRADFAKQLAGQEVEPANA